MDEIDLSKSKDIKELTRTLDGLYRTSDSRKFLTIEKFSPETFYKCLKEFGVSKSRDVLVSNRFVKIFLDNIDIQPIVTAGTFKVVGTQDVDEILKSKVNMVKINIQTVFFNRLKGIVIDENNNKIYQIDKGLEDFEKNLKHFVNFPDNATFYFSSFTSLTGERENRLVKIKGSIENFTFRQNANDIVVYVNFVVNGKIEV